MNRTQCKMARVALGWTAADLARHSHVGSATIARFELGKDITEENRNKIAAALERGGAEFSANARKVGVMVPRET